ncbi:MAG: PIG-L family deacetylase [Terriglobia bacterium]|jgi:LmbE family N-acetylglucosaminyl deacetylase
MRRRLGSTRIVEGTTAVQSVVQAFVLVVGVALAARDARPQVTFFTPVTDNASYNVGSEVRVKVVLPPSDQFGSAPIDISANIRYAGEQKYLEEKNVELARGVTLGAKESATEYYPLWKVAEDAKTGLYEVTLQLSGSTSVTNAQVVPVTSFSVYRKLVKIERIRLSKAFYTPGDAISCEVDLKNLSGHAISNLRVEFSDRYWPWTAQTSERAGVDVVTIAQDLSLPAGGDRHLESARAAVVTMPKPPEQPHETPEAKAAAAKRAKEPAVQQYAVVVWDGARRNIYDIAFSSEVFVAPAGITEPKPYSLQYVYPSLDDVNVTSYRHFYPAGLDSAAIQLDREHTMYPSGSEATVRFSLRNPTSQPWRGVAVRARLLDSKGKELATKQIATGVNLDPGSAAVAEDATFTLPAGQSGIFRAQVEVNDASGETLATNVLELAANPLPHSILIFCAHQDDEGAHAGMIRAAIENHIPIHFVYFTSGDAGSCDRYYEHSCAPDEARNFGALRMEEAHRSVGHLGVPRENIFFLGLPDGGSGQIWYDHVEPSNPYLSVLLASEHAPYEGLAEPNLPFARKAVVEAAERFIREFQPEVIYTGHPDERHVDHRTNNWFVVKALQELLREGVVRPDQTLLTDQVYGPGPQAHAPYKYQKNVLSVSPDAMALAQEAQWYYQSQGGNRALGHLRTFDKLRNEEVHWQILDWKDHEGWNEKQ